MVRSASLLFRSIPLDDEMVKVPSVALTLAKVRLGVMIGAAILAGGFGRANAQSFSDQSFSADIMMTRDHVAVSAGRLQVLDGKVRIEIPEFPDAFFLVDIAKPSAYFVRPAMHTYMDARQSSALTRLFVPVDPGDPCRQWQAMAQLAGVAGQGDWRCERTREEPIEGRDTAVVRATFAAGGEYLGWIDPLRRFPLRIDTGQGASFTLANIQDAAQPVTAFELPSGLRKFSPEALVEQIKQSDVWVSGPNDAESSRH
jgi:hypothetical protein